MLRIRRDISRTILGQIAVRASKSSEACARSTRAGTAILARWASGTGSWEHGTGAGTLWGTDTARGCSVTAELALSIVVARVAAGEEIAADHGAVKTGEGERAVAGLDERLGWASGVDTGAIRRCVARISG